MKLMTSLSFVIDAINRHYARHGALPQRVELSYENLADICADLSAAHLIALMDEGRMPTVRGVPIAEVSGIVPSLIRFDGLREEM